LGIASHSYKKGYRIFRENGINPKDIEIEAEQAFPEQASVELVEEESKS
jgi:hypothetical protein